MSVDLYMIHEYLTSIDINPKFKCQLFQNYTLPLIRMLRK